MVQEKPPRPDKQDGGGNVKNKLQFHCAGVHPCSTALRRRFCFSAFAGVVDLAFTPPGVETVTLPLPADLILTGIISAW